MLPHLMETKNELTISISRTESAGMETILMNLIEEGDQVMVGVNGLFGERMCGYCNPLLRPTDSSRGPLG